MLLVPVERVDVDDLRVLLEEAVLPELRGHHDALAGVLELDPLVLAGLELRLALGLGVASGISGGVEGAAHAVTVPRSSVTRRPGA